MYNNSNPFTPTFGSIPLHLAGRDRLINDVLEGLINGPGDPNRATIYIGARGSGKTVLLTKIAEEASKNGWVSVNVNAQPDIAKRMNVTPKYAGMYRARLIEQGIIGSRGYGKVAFDLPMFREYVKKRTFG